MRMMQEKAKRLMPIDDRTVYKFNQAHKSSFKESRWNSYNFSFLTKSSKLSDNPCYENEAAVYINSQ